MKFNYLFFGLLLLLFTSQAYAITDTNLVDYWKFDETTGELIDYVSYDNNGTNFGATTGVTGKINTAYSFANNRIELTNNNSFFGSEKSVSLWFYSGSNVTTAQHLIDTTDSDKGTNEIRIFLENGKIFFYQSRGGSYDFQISGGTITANNWYHIVGTWKTNEAKLYINNNQIGSTDTSLTPVTTGAIHSSFSSVWVNGGWNMGVLTNGRLDEISNWNRILSETDINDLYNAGTGLTYPFVTEYINVDFNYVVRKDLNKIILKDTSTVSGVTKTAWTWTNNGSTISTAQDYNLTATELTDYNICLHVDTNVSDINGDKCYSFNTGDWTPPVTTFSSYQVPNTTDQNITLTCTDNNSGCYRINYIIDNNVWTYNYNPTYIVNNIATEATHNLSWKTPTLVNTHYIKDNQSNSILRVSNKIYQTANTWGTMYSKYKYYYTDGTSEDSNINSTTAQTFQTKDYNVPTNGKDINKIEEYIWADGIYDTQSTMHWKDSNIYYYDKNIQNPTTIIYSGAGSHSIQYFSTDNSDNNETIKTSNFTTYGNGRFYFKDENSGSNLTGVQVNFNGVDYNSGANNYLDFNFQTLSSTNTTYLFTISKSGYSTRYYQTDLNYFGEFNNTFALIPTIISKDIIFKMFPPTGTSVLSNTYIEFKDKDTNYTVSRLKSNDEGELTVTLKSDDQNYLVWISEGLYIYQAVQLTVYYPKDEVTQNYITGNWRLEITDNISYQDLNIPQSTNKIIYLLPNTKYPFTIAVQDVAGTYFKRRWSKLYTGNPITDTLQPYLISADDGIAVKFVLQDPKRDSIENVVINIYKNVGGIKTLVSNSASDVTGNALFFLIAGEKYWLDFTYNGEVIFETQNYTVTSSTVYWTINLATREIKTVDGTFITIGFNPIQDYILKNATNISYKVTASKLNRTRAEFYIIQDGNKIITYTRDAPCTTPCTVTIPIEDLNITLGNKVYLDLNVYIDSNNYIFNYKKTWSYGTTSNIDTHDLFVKARIDFGCTTDTMWPCPLTSIVSIIIMILLIGSMVFTFNFVNPKGLLVAGLGILAVFTYLGWFWWVALVLIIIASIFYLRGD